MTTVREIFETMDYGPAPESDAEARKWLESRAPSGQVGQFGHFIDGAWTQPGKTFEVIDPSTAAVIARVSQGTKADVDAAVGAARRALPAWKELPGHVRSRHLYALAREVQLRNAEAVGPTRQQPQDCGRSLDRLNVAWHEVSGSSRTGRLKFVNCV